MEITPCIARAFAIHINYFKYMNSKTKKALHIGVLSIIIQITSNFTLHKQQNESHE